MIDRKTFGELSEKIVAEQPENDLFGKVLRRGMAMEALDKFAKKATEEEQQWFLKLCKADK